MIKNCLVTLLLILTNTCFSQTYVFFLHNKFYEDFTLEDSHPQYGKYEYREIISAFEKEGFIVISEKRSRDTPVNVYANKISLQIDSLLKLGTKPGNITVIGTSKGGYIAQSVSAILKNEKINFIFIASCSKEDPTENSTINFSGNILSIYEASDAGAQSCPDIKNRSSLKVPNFKEIKLTTGLKHGFLFKAMPEWLEPSVKWAKQNYK